MNHAAQSAPAAGANYKFAMRIEALDGGDNVNISQGDVPVVLDEWDLAGCFLQNVQYGENNYATSDVVNITMQIRYDNADHFVNGASQLQRPAVRATGLGTASANGSN